MSHYSEYLFDRRTKTVCFNVLCKLPLLQLRQGQDVFNIEPDQIRRGARYFQALLKSICDWLQ